jgi:hypothetical protein
MSLKEIVHECQGGQRPRRVAFEELRIERWGRGKATHHRHPCPGGVVSEDPYVWTTTIRRLTKREKASLNSETCSSVRESA